MMRVLITGASGQVGWETARVLHPSFEIIALDERKLDFNRPETVRRAVTELAPDLIVNCAAYTAVDRAEADEASARRVNADAVLELALAARHLEAPVIHFSTDYVFQGNATSPYRETDPTGPLSAYGRTKLLGEQALSDSGVAYWLFRTSWVYSSRGRNFVKAIVARARDTGQVRVVNDQLGSPTWARTLAQVVGTVVAPYAKSRETLCRHAGDTGGLYHVTSRGEATWCEFARFVFDQLKPYIGRPVEVLPIVTAEFPTAAVRPAYSVLDTGKFSRTFGIALPHWSSAATLCLAEFEH